jgi:hypothetical protein
MIRRHPSRTVAATVAAPALFAVAQHTAMGLPAPTSVDIKCWGDGPDLTLFLDAITDLHIWAEHLGVPVTWTYTSGSVLAGARADRALAGLDVHLHSSAHVDDQDDVDARDRAADIADLAADRAMELVA